MITLAMLEGLKENDGLTLKKGYAITYKSGWQVATEGIECKVPIEALKAILAYDGTCGVWFSGGIYYIDKSHRVDTKREALQIGRECKQISILRWKDMRLVYC